MPFMCLCGRGFNPLNKINFIAKPEGKQPTVMHFKSQSIDVTIENSMAFIEIQQVFLNELDTPVEATYMFPTDPDQHTVVSYLNFSLGDRQV